MKQWPTWAQKSDTLEISSVLLRQVFRFGLGFIIIKATLVQLFLIFIDYILHVLQHVLNVFNNTKRKFE